MAEGETPVIEEDAHGHHHHGTGVKWLDVILASSAILISVVSLIVSVNHGRTMERLVEENALQVKASTLPILRVTTGNQDVEHGAPMVHLDLSNGGTGPAIIDWLSLSYRGKPVANVKELLDACCRTDPTRHLGPTAFSLGSGQTLPANQSIELFAARPGTGDPDMYARLERKGRFAIGVSACYCSVLDQCWLSDFRQTTPRPIAECRPSRPAISWGMLTPAAAPDTSSGSPARG